MEVFFAVCLGISLSASAGLRAFLPLFVTGLLARQGWVPLGEHFAWLGATPALIALGVATLVEVAADKVPALDHLLDLIQGPVRTGAGMIVFAAVSARLPAWATVLGAVVAGGGTSAAVHTTKSAVRVGSTAVSGGLANPVLSVGEDLTALLTSVLSLLLSVVAVIVAVLTLAAGFFAVRKLVRWWRGGPPPPEREGQPEPEPT